MTQAYVPWNRETWDKTKEQIKELSDDYEMNNPEIQEKLLEIVKQKQK